MKQLIRLCITNTFQETYNPLKVKISSVETSSKLKMVKEFQLIVFSCHHSKPELSRDERLVEEE